MTDDTKDTVIVIAAMLAIGLLSSLSRPGKKTPFLTDFRTRLHNTVLHRYESLQQWAFQSYFQSHDEDKSGNISNEEMQKILDDIGMGLSPLTRRAWAERIIKEYDTNNTGDLTWPELQNLAQPPGYNPQASDPTWA